MAERFATYKGRTYILLWKGKTKYGVRAHLKFTDGSKDFWCDGSLVSETDAPAPRSRGYSRSGEYVTCNICGGRYNSDDQDDCECPLCGRVNGNG